MHLSVKKGVRYAGGRYEFTVNITRGSLNEPDLTKGWSILANYITGEDCDFLEEGIQYLLQFDSKRRFEKRYTLKQGHLMLARIIFSQNKSRNTFHLRIRAARGLKQKEYNTLDKIVRGVFGDFDRIKGYGPEDVNNQQESQPCCHESQHLSQLEKQEHDFFLRAEDTPQWYQTSLGI